MKHLMKQLVVGSAVVLTLVANTTVAYAKEKGVSGSWTLSAEGYVLTLVLAQRGTTISGTLEDSIKLLPCRGRFLAPTPIVPMHYTEADLGDDLVAHREVGILPN